MNRRDQLPQSVPTRLLALPDGRRLAIAEYGDPTGTPIVYCHGFGGSRLQVHPDHDIARRLGVRLIAPDRPGIGRSDPAAGRRVVDWPRDVAALADALGLDRFGVLGYSGGGAYALACAAALPERVAVVGLVSSAAPFGGAASRAYLTPEWRRVRATARFAPWLMRPFFARIARQCARDPEGTLARSIAAMAPADRAVASDPEVCPWLLAAAIEGYAQDGRGVADDALALARDWGCDLAAVSQEVRIWHGEADPVWPPATGAYLARALSHSCVTFVPGAAHLLLLSHWYAIVGDLATLLRDSARAPARTAAVGQGAL